MWDKLESIEERYKSLENDLAQPDVASDPPRMAQLGRDFSELEEIIRPYRRARVLMARLEQSREELREATDEELREMLRHDIDEGEAELAKLEAELKLLIAPRDPADSKDCILEVRAGAGGDEASLFASELLLMYMNFSAKRGWTVELVDETESGLKGIKEAVVEVRGRGAFGWLKFESGVHRVQRVPVTESSGRIHTSTATVAVMPIVDDVEVELKENDVRVDVYRSSGAGGQHVNKTSSAIRLTHVPTNIVVICQDERSQLQNKEKAFRVLRARLYEMEQQKIEAVQRDARRSLVGSGDRSEKIRTYNFPDGRITDHRIGFKVHDVPGFLGGNIEDMLQALRTHEEGGTAIQVVELYTQVKTRLAAMPAVVDSKAEADIIFRHRLGLSPAERLQYGRGEVEEAASEAVQSVLAQRERGTPLAYCTGRADFDGHSFVVSPAVLIPRPETEVLVQRGADFLDDRLLKRHNKEKILADGKPALLDLGCGSGCIGISLALRFPELQVTLADVSEPALAVAEENARRLGVIERCEFRQGDWFAWAKRRERFDLILCNPPYVTRRDDPRLAASVREHEPSIAVFLEEQPEEFYFRLARKAVSHLSSGGLFAVEVGYDTAWPARCGFDKVHSITRGKGIHDFSGIERVIWGIRR